ncbi:MAG: ribosome maturation factor RimP [Firmicutes bacterium]|nr:ribosome maturation factor RimP [Bacillota bacterium]
MAKKKGIVCDYSQIERDIWQLAEATVAENGAELIDVEFTAEAGNHFLRIFIDRDGQPVDHQLCETVSNALDPLLDEADLIRESYYLEISSPGLERPLKRPADFIRYAGQDVTLHLYAPWQGQKQIDGRLIGLAGDCIQIDADGQTLAFPLAQVAKAHLRITF